MAKPSNSTIPATAPPSAPADAPGEQPGGPSSDKLLTRLPNGLTVLIKRDSRFPLVSLRLYVHAGSAYETPKEAGISHLLEHMVFKGTAAYPKGSIAAAVEQTGGYLNAATSFDYTMYLTDMTSGHWRTGLKVLKEMAFSPTIDPEELTSEKEVVIAELKRGKDSPGSAIFEMTQKSALHGTPYAAPIIGYEDTVRGITPEDIHKYIGAHYHPYSMLLVIVGDVDTAEALAEATAMFGNLPARADLPQAMPGVPSTVTPQVRTTPTVVTGPWNKVHMTLAIPVPGYGDTRSAELDVLSQLLSGDATSHLYRTFKYEKRLVDSISLDNVTLEQTGLLYLYVVLDPDKVEPFWQAFTADLATWGSLTFSQEEMDRAVLSITDNLFRSKETIAGYASKLGYFQFFGKGEMDEEAYLRAVKGATQASLTALMKATFVPQHMAINVLAPKDMPMPAGADSLGTWMQATLMKNAGSLAANAAATPEQATGAAGTASRTPELIDLGNNRTLVLQKDPTLPYAAVSLRFMGGERLLAPKDAGLGQFAATLLGKGTKTMSMQEFEAFQSNRAASLSASSGKLSFSLNLSTPSQYLGDMFTLLGQAINEPAFLDEEAARVRESQIAAITMREDQPTGLAFRRLYPFLFGDHTYGLKSLGDKERVSAFTAGEARAFWEHQQRYPWVLSVAGDFDRDAVIKAAQSLPVPGAALDALPAPAWGKEKALDLKLDNRQQAHLMLVFPTEGVGKAERAGLDLLETILAGQSGLLFRDLRDKQGLGYTVTAFGWETKDAGTLTFYIGTEPEKMEQARQGFLKVIKDLQTTLLPDEDIERGKNQIIANFYREQQTLKARSDEAANLLTLGQPLDANKKLMEKISAITAKDLQALAKKYLDPQRAYIVKVMP